MKDPETKDITILGEAIKKEHQTNWYLYLYVQKILVESNFDWLSLNIVSKYKTLFGRGVLDVNGKRHIVLLRFSPFNKYHYDRIYIDDKSIKFHNDIHLYNDLSLCLYHPIIDQPLVQKIPLYKMVPWISEWIVFYEQWKKYGVWLGKEIKH
jgi:hypothetical protein